MIIVVLLLSLLLPVPSYGQFFVEGFVGKEASPNTDLGLSQPNLDTNILFKNVEWEDQSFKLPPYYGYGFGYFLKSRPWIGFRVEFKHQKVIAKTSQRYQVEGVLDGLLVNGQSILLHEVIQELEVSHGLNNVSLAFLLRLGLNKSLEVPEGHFQVYSGLASGVTISNLESVVRGKEFLSGYQLGSTPIFEISAGSRFHLTQRFYSFLEYKMTRSRVSSAVVDGKASALFRTHQLALGLGMNFP